MGTPKTYSAMLRHIAELQKQAEAMRVKEAAGVIKRVQEAMQVYGLTPEDLKVKKPRVVKETPAKVEPEVPKVRKKVTRPAKFADDKGNAWAGGGSMPVWLREQVEQGKSIEEFRIKQG